MRIATPLFTLFLLSLGLLASGCSEYEVAQQDVGLAYDAETDVLTLTIDSRGLHAAATGVPRLFGSPATEEERIAGAVERLRAAADGAPYFVLLASPLALDLTKVPEAITREAKDADWADIEALWLGLRDGISVEAAGLYLDSEQEVGLYQRVQVKEAEKLITFLNELLSRSVLDARAAEGSSPREVAAEESRNAYARQGGPWVVLDGEALEVRMPLAPWQVANTMKGIAELPFAPEGAEMEPWEEEVGRAMGRALFSGLETFEVVDGIARFRYPFGENGRIDLPYARMRASEPAKHLRDALSVEGLQPLSPGQVAAKLTGPR